jgi:hypothetical protein
MPKCQAFAAAFDGLGVLIAQLVIPLFFKGGALNI